MIVHFDTAKGLRCGVQSPLFPLPSTAVVAAVTCVRCKQLLAADEAKAEARARKKRSCNQWSREFKQCGAPMAFQSLKGGARWCGPCRERQLAEARAKAVSAQRDIRRLEALTPVGVDVDAHLTERRTR